MYRLAPGLEARMPRLSERNPSYRKHRPSGQAVVTVDGHGFYLGPWRSRSSRDEYDRIIGEWLANGRRLPRSTSAVVNDLDVNELVARFWPHAQAHYRHPDGTPTSEAANFRDALRPLVRLYGKTLVADFGPLSLRAMRDEMIRLGWCRASINRNVGRVRHVFRWAAGRELCAASIYQSLAAVEPLQAGRTEARESEPVRPVADETIAGTLPFLSPTIATMVKLQRLTGCRPGEVCAMRTGDLDRTEEVWTYAPAHHKTAHRGKSRIIHIGPHICCAPTCHLHRAPH